MPVIAFLRSTSAVGSEHLVAGFEQGLKEAGFVAGQNVAIDYRWGNDQLDRLPGLAADLIHRQPAVIIGNILATRAIMADQPLYGGGGEGRSNDWPASSDYESYRRERIPFRFCGDGPAKRGRVAHRQRSIFPQPTSTTRRTGGSLRTAFLRPPSALRRGRCPYELRIEPVRCLSSRRHLRWPDSQRGDTRQYAG